MPTVELSVQSVIDLAERNGGARSPVGGACAHALPWAVWAVHAGAKVDLGWTGLGSAWPYLLAGVLTVACVIAGFVWLAFFSERRGFDDRANPH